MEDIRPHLEACVGCRVDNLYCFDTPCDTCLTHHRVCDKCLELGHADFQFPGRVCDRCAEMGIECKRCRIFIYSTDAAAPYLADARVDDSNQHLTDPLHATRNDLCQLCNYWLFHNGAPVSLSMISALWHIHGVRFESIVASELSIRGIDKMSTDWVLSVLGTLNELMNLRELHVYAPLVSTSPARPWRTATKVADGQEASDVAWAGFRVALAFEKHASIRIIALKVPAIVSRSLNLGTTNPRRLAWLTTEDLIVVSSDGTITGIRVLFARKWVEAPPGEGKGRKKDELPKWSTRSRAGMSWGGIREVCILHGDGSEETDVLVACSSTTAFVFIVAQAEKSNKSPGTLTLSTSILLPEPHSDPLIRVVGLSRTRALVVRASSVSSLNIDGDGEVTILATLDFKNTWTLGVCTMVPGPNPGAGRLWAWNARSRDYVSVSVDGAGTVVADDAPNLVSKCPLVTPDTVQTVPRRVAESGGGIIVLGSRPGTYRVCTRFPSFPSQRWRVLVLCVPPPVFIQTVLIH